MMGHPRAWLIKEKKMVSVSNVGFGGPFVFVTAEDEDSDIDAKMYRDGRDCILMWPTGLTDKNKKQIYEGDIVNMALFFRGTTGTHWFSIEKDAGCFQLVSSVLNYEDPLFLHSNDTLEIIGNIHENPELVAEGESK